MRVSFDFGSSRANRTVLGLVAVVEFLLLWGLSI